MDCSYRPIFRVGPLWKAGRQDFPNQNEKARGYWRGVYPGNRPPKHLVWAPGSTTLHKTGATPLLFAIMHLKAGRPRIDPLCYRQNH